MPKMRESLNLEKCAEYLKNVWKTYIQGFKAFSKISTPEKKNCYQIIKKLWIILWKWSQSHEKFRCIYFFNFPLRTVKLYHSQCLTKNLLNLIQVIFHIFKSNITCFILPNILNVCLCLRVSESEKKNLYDHPNI